MFRSSSEKMAVSFTMGISNLTGKRLNTLFRFKDSLNKKIRSFLVYRYTCSNCNVTYYGKTYRHFFTRAAEHMGISNLTGKRLNTLFRFKDSLNKKIRSFLVYRYTSSNCNVTYYGKTYRHFFTRAVEHMGISNLTGKRLNTLFRFKDSLNKKIRSFLVYRYTCSNCNVTYYGKTYRHFFTRAAEHMGISNLTGKRLNTLFRFKDSLNKKIRSFLVYRYTCSNCNVIYYGKTYRHFFTRAAEHMGISNLTGKRLNTLFRFKDSLNKKIRSFLVYRYTCSNCNVTYYGKTYRHFFTRAAEHMGISNLTGKRLNTLFRFRDSLNKKIRSFLVYRYTCSNCNVTYYGKTYRHFFTRAAEHMGISNLTGKRLNTLFRFRDSLNKKIRSFLVYRYTCSNCNVTYYGKTYRHFFTRAAEHMGISNLTGKRLNTLFRFKDSLNKKVC